MRFSYNTYNRSSAWGGAPSLPEQFRVAAAAGYDFVGVDLPAVEAHVALGTSLGQLAESLDDAAMSCFELIVLPVTADATATRFQVERMLPVIRSLRPQAVLIVPSHLDPAVAENLARTADAIGELGALPCIEYVAYRPIRSLRDARALVAMTPAEVKIVIDVWHHGFGPETEEDLAGADADEIGFIQLSDAPEPLSDDLAHETRHRRVMPGEGCLDVAGFCQTLRDEVGYDGVASVEILSAEWRDAELGTFVRRSLETSRAAWSATVPTTESA